jgi:hypothetical protein
MLESHAVREVFSGAPTALNEGGLSKSKLTQGIHQYSGRLPLTPSGLPIKAVFVSNARRANFKCELFPKYWFDAGSKCSSWVNWKNSGTSSSLESSSTS